MKVHGTVHKYGDNIDTDVIIPARYLNTASHSELASHCMEDIDKEFISRVKPGDIIVADKNFGCGSSREHAPLAIKCAGVGCVIAPSFARIFYRNAINPNIYPRKNNSPCEINAQGVIFLRLTYPGKLWSAQRCCRRTARRPSEGHRRGRSDRIRRSRQCA